MVPFKFSKPKAEEENEQADGLPGMEKERADRLQRILIDVNKRIVNEANKLHKELPEFHRKIHYLYNQGNARDLANVLIEELEIHLNQKRTLEQHVEKLKRNIKDLTSKLREKDNERAQWHATKAKMLRDSKSEKNLMQREHESERAQWHAIKAKMLRDSKSEKNLMQKEHESERAQWHATKAKMLRDSKSEKNLMQNEHDSAIAQMSQEHESATVQMTQAHESTIAQISQAHESVIAQMTQAHESAIAQMTQAHESKQAQLLAQISQMEKEHASEQEKMRKDFEAGKLQLKRQTAEEEARLKTEFKVKKAQLEIAHAEEKEQLRKDVDEYSKALLARDDFKPTPDNEIKGRFLDLVQDVDALARLEWKVNQKEWTSQVLRLLSPNQRLLKKQILQDSIWVILHKYIFCSPFRIFGEEGQSLETQWNGKGLSSDTLYLSSQALTSADSQLDNGNYTWPKPEMEIERWRYVNIKECRAALTQSVPSEWDPRAKLKKGFKTSIDALRKEFMSTLGEVANLDKSNIQAMERMTIKAANMWLEFGMQRCRILVVLQGSNLKPAKERIQRAQEDTLKLVVVPELKRFGNSKGLDLHIEETVGGCDGETVDVSMRQ